jgi:hypothetical protein
MYFLVALFLALTSACVWYFSKDKKSLHLEILPITYGAATLMWLVDCIASAIEGEGFLSFEIPTDIWISLWTLGAGLLFWGAILLVLHFIRKKQNSK